ncbi:hypothetical protein QUF79_24015 [Fictibacillus enclensis]|uniref:hypothetical protein n=1 Tax=Fictibacillus enclensis TaxID=1017270 RepID=UPI0025A1971B|nr:hypothetical protein [Fictibacillus enclensis]MDM5201094.1 hypothetical protein [Fictibacillus enclensis]
MSKMAIKILTNGPVGKYIVPIRKLTGLGNTDIKTKIENNDFFAETDADDMVEMEGLKGLVESLIKLGANVKIFDSYEFSQGTFNYQEISYKEFNNNIGRLKEITEELQDYDDAVSDED